MSMKAILFIAMMAWGPNYPEKPVTAHVLRYPMASMEACQKAKAHERDFAGKVGNLPGYRRVHHTWCEPVNESWPMFDMSGRKIQ